MLPTGAQLKPYDPAHPGNANPQGLAQVGDKVYATISNQYYDAAAQTVVNAGPGFLVGIVPSTGAQTLIDLGGSDEKQCQNPGFVRDSNGLLYAQGWTKCTSPHVFRHLKPGRFRFQVKAILNGVEDPTPASWFFKVLP